jgi:hypothetical protein
MVLDPAGSVIERRVLLGFLQKRPRLNRFRLDLEGFDQLRRKRGAGHKNWDGLIPLSVDQGIGRWIALPAVSIRDVVQSDHMYLQFLVPDLQPEKIVEAAQPERAGRFSGAIRPRKAR